MKKVTQEIVDAVYKLKTEVIDPTTAAATLGISKAQMYRLMDGSLKNVRAATWNSMKPALEKYMAKEESWIDNNLRENLKDPLLKDLVQNWSTLSPEEAGQIACILTTAGRRQQ